jgi:hypothetical protein
MDTILYAAAKAAVTTEIEAHSAFLDRAVADTGATLLAALRATIRTALPVHSDGTPHVLQPLAELIAAGVNVGDFASGIPIFEPAAVALLERVDASTAHNVDRLAPSAIRGTVKRELDAYGDALMRRKRQTERLA